jgi:hypothetical protein
MKPPNNLIPDFDDVKLEFPFDNKISSAEILAGMRAGMRTKDFLAKYNLKLPEFKQILEEMLRSRALSVDVYKEWKAAKPKPAPAAVPSGADSVERKEPLTITPSDTTHNVATYVITDPEKNNSWALQLFSTPRQKMQGARFKVNLHGKKYLFVVEEMLFRGQVEILPDAAPSKTELKNKREEALQFITQHGWAAYLEQRALEANLGSDRPGPIKKARLVLLHCRNNTFLAAVHIPAPAINLYVGNSLEKVKSRLAKSIDLDQLDI